MKTQHVRLNKNKIRYTPDASNNYPEQNYEYLGRTIMIRYMNDSLDHLFEKIRPEEEYIKPIFKVLRWDMNEETGKVALVNTFQDVIIADVADLLTHKWYRQTVYDDICFLLSDEERATMTEEEFIERIYSKEKVYRKSADSEWVKFNKEDHIIIEYEKDKFNPDIEPTPEPESEEPTRGAKNKGDSFLENIKDYSNIPFRPTELVGYLVKDDLDGIAVAYDYDDEILGTYTYRVVLDTEANFYADRVNNTLENLKEKYYMEGIGGRINLWT